MTTLRYTGTEPLRLDRDGVLRVYASPGALLIVSDEALAEELLAREDFEEAAGDEADTTE